MRKHVIGNVEAVLSKNQWGNGPAGLSPGVSFGTYLAKKKRKEEKLKKTTKNYFSLLKNCAFQRITHILKVFTKSKVGSLWQVQLLSVVE